MKKKMILTPGPTMVPPEVLAAGAQPIIHHRSPDYTPVFNKIQQQLKYVFQTEHPVVIFAASGTGAMEAAVVSTLSPGDKVITVEGGKFGERWREIAAAYGAEVISLEIEWGTAIEPAKIKEELKKNPDTKAVFITHCETSTGVLTDIKAIGEIVSKTEAILVVDAVSSLGAEELYTDDWHLDIVVTGSQKALMLPPGLAFASIGPRAQKLMENSRCPKYYFSLKGYLKSLGKETTPFTPAVSLNMALERSLEIIAEEGLENIWRRHQRLAEATQAGVKALGLELFSQRPSNVVTAVKIPANIDGEKIPKILRDEFGITIAGGQEHLKGKIFRIATLGYADTFDVTTVMAALELTLKKLNYPVELGQGVKATLEVLGTA